MSNYRDDTQETAIASDGTWAGLTAIVEESARIAGTLAFGLMVMHADGATASDEVIDRAVGVIIEQAAASDAVLDARRSTSLTIERAAAGERWLEALRVVHDEYATAGDAVLDAVRVVTVEQAQAIDEVIATRRADSLVMESARATDWTARIASEMVIEGAVAGDWTGGQQRAMTLAQDSAALADETFGGLRRASPALDSASIADSVIDHLAARDIVSDGAVVEDATWSNLPDVGQAWTANADTWAMSRYAPYHFGGLAVIDGVAYGTTSTGVYALNGDGETIMGGVTTGKLDLGQGGLVHPLAAYLEYALDGSAEMDVTTTQSGKAETYTYTLPAETADELTNGRFVFGRGLRGRHFSFALRMTGTRGHINDLSIHMVPTKRKV